MTSPPHRCLSSAFGAGALPSVHPSTSGAVAGTRSSLLFAGPRGRAPLSAGEAGARAVPPPCSPAAVVLAARLRFTASSRGQNEGRGSASGLASHHIRLLTHFSRLNGAAHSTYNIDSAAASSRPPTSMVPSSLARTLAALALVGAAQAHRPKTPHQHSPRFEIVRKEHINSTTTTTAAVDSSLGGVCTTSECIQGQTSLKGESRLDSSQSPLPSILIRFPLTLQPAYSSLRL